MSSLHPEVPSTHRRPCQNDHQTPRKHKVPSTAALRGLKNHLESVEIMKAKITKRLKLPFEMDEWQAHMIHRIYQGYDSILIAGTGYGKSLIFQGLAAFDKKKMVLIISPLKALERDQVIYFY